MPFDKQTLVIPDDTKFEEHTILTTGDVIVGNHAELQFGVKTSGRVFAGERATVGGHVEADGEVHVDTFSTVKGNVASGGNVYLGEKVSIRGKLSLKGDLDVGDDVTIKEGFEAKGWINIRNPVPIVIYVFLYLLELLKLGESQEVERILKELEEARAEDILVGEVFLYVPDSSKLGLQSSTVKGNLRVGRGCRILGNYHVRGSAIIGAQTQFYGAVRATGAFHLAAGSEVQGDVEAAGDAVVGEGCHILGNLTARSVEMHQSCVIDGVLTAPEGVRFVTQASQEAQEKVERFEAGIQDDIVDLLK